MSNSVVYEDNRVDPSKVGKVKSIYEQDVEEVIGAPVQPSYNPEVVDPNVRRRKVKMEDSTDSGIHMDGSTGGVKTNTQPNYTKYLIIVILILILGGVSSWYFNLASVKTERVVIFDTLWERQVHPQENRLVTQEGWELPPGATVLRTKREIYKYNTISEETGREICTDKVEKVPSHKEYSHTNTKIKEDGSVSKKDHYKVVYKNNVKTYCYKEKVTKEIPEFRTKYYFQIWMWTDLPALITKGSGKNQKPYFAKYKQDSTHKIKSKVTIYQIKFEKLDGKVLTYKSTPQLYKKANQNLKRECTVRWNYFELKDLIC